ncbi:hypothetical protein [Aquamicrobium sp.]|uniref:hypothetical protein n=1 Tax=Aquamicrobium sp. TaxID=1872579 RepID=UPI002583E919|nr:hypothetical protein [Aquamicrobium sp.]MCK9552771.1 hypothetical protein [Aquamicrobium sp.]
MEDSRPVSPCIAQTEKDIEGGNRGRVYVSNAGAFYMKHGKNCFHPKGLTRLVVPTDEVLA